MTAYSFKKRFIVPISLGLGIPYQVDHVVDVNAKPKRQTIRAHGLRRHARPGETLQLYTGMRTKQCRKIGDARCTKVGVIEMVLRARSIAITVSGFPLIKAAAEELARMDGFADIADMLAFWRKEHPDIDRFEGVMIQWEPLA